MVLDTLLAVILLIGAVGYIALGIQLIAGRRGVGTLPSGVLFLFVALWVMGGAIELFASSFFMFSVGRTFHYVGTSIVPIVAYVYFREYTGQSTSIHRLVLLLIIPFVSITLAATNAFHEMVWALPATNAQGDFLTRPVAWGPYFLFVHAPYTYALGVAAALSLIMHTSAVARAHRKGLFLLLAASLGPASAALAYDFGFGPNTVSFIPFVFTLMLP
ncbi:MAG: histidine kinase N-terminal 7TM domain-containing protein, partial [Pseudomonadota bacterium]